jgi:hypothetical protein
LCWSLTGAVRTYPLGMPAQVRTLQQSSIFCFQFSCWLSPLGGLSVGTYVRLLLCRSRRLLYCHTHQAQQVAQCCMYYNQLNSDYDTIIHSTQYVQAIYTSISHTAFRPPNTTCPKFKNNRFHTHYAVHYPLLKTRNPPHVSISSLSLGTSFLQERRRMACVKSCTYHESTIRYTVTPRLPHLSSTITRKLSSSSSL